MNHDVFISHSTKYKDQEAANRIYDYLNGKGIGCFMDTRNLIPGVPYPDQLTRAIEESRVVVLLFSSNSNASSAVRNEITMATTSCNKPIIAVRIEDTLPSGGLKLLLASPQWADAFPPPLEKHLPKIIEAIRYHLQIEHLEPSVTPREFSEDISSAPRSKFELVLKNHYWHDISFGNLPNWVKRQKRKLDEGKDVVGRTFRYRFNRRTRKYQIRLRHHLKSAIFTPK